MTAPVVESRILINQAEEGMVLSRGVDGPGGMGLCGAGTALTKGIIERLMNRGVRRVWVTGKPNVPGADDYQTAMRKLHERFQRVHHIPFMAAVEDTAGRVLAKRG